MATTPKKKAGGKPVKNLGGRPTVYRSTHVVQAAKLCALGATDADLANFFDVEPRTIFRWKLEHKDFSAAIKLAKGIADERVERSLFARANGYEHPEMHISNFQGVITETPIRKYYPPDTTACIFWLKNRKQLDWRDRHELTGKDGGALTINSVSYADSLDIAAPAVAIDAIANANDKSAA